MKHITAALFVPHEGCPHQCAFCNQVSISGKSSRLTPQDIENTANIVLKNGYNNAELAFFGGSFTAIDRDYMLKLLTAAKPYTNGKPFTSIRISTRPDSIDDDILTLLKEFNVKAIELGAQSMDNKVLELNSRGHNATDTIKSAEKIKNAGFELGLQMMTGLYGDTDKGTINTAKDLIALEPDTMRIYPTIVLKGSPLETLFYSGKYKPQSIDEAVSLCSRLLLMFHKADIPVIRLGLHSGGNVDEGYIAGAYHPAFRELCESEIYLQKVLEHLKIKKFSNGDLLIYVAPNKVSQMIGHGKRNIHALNKLDFNCKVLPLEGLDKYEIKLLHI